MLVGPPCQAELVFNHKDCTTTYRVRSTSYPLARRIKKTVWWSRLVCTRCIDICVSYTLLKSPTSGRGEQEAPAAKSVFYGRGDLGVSSVGELSHSATWLREPIPAQVPCSPLRVEARTGAEMWCATSLALNLACYLTRAGSLTVLAVSGEKRRGG